MKASEHRQQGSTFSWQGHAKQAAMQDGDYVLCFVGPELHGCTLLRHTQCAESAQYIPAGLTHSLSSEHSLPPRLPLLPTSDNATESAAP